MTKAEMDIKKKVELHEQKKIESMKSTKYYYKQTDALWLQLAQGIDTDAALRAFFDRWQPAICSRTHTAPHGRSRRRSRL
jgi:hypothetical protein|tara:strand:- start:192 stop:431 length:240 start_codon:yes stop_codon:yes gene_type:complete